MSYLMEAEAASRRRGRWLAALAAVGLLAAAALAFSLGRAGGPRPAPAAAGESAAADVSWSRVGPWVVPSSPGHGPFRSAAGIASGFSHDELGAALAAVNISQRLSIDVGPMVYTTTARTQTYGAVATLLEWIRAQPLGGSSPPTEVYYRVVAGDPGEDLVLVSIASKTPESASAGGYWSSMLTLHWRDGDWRLQVPLTPAQLVGSVEGYSLLGVPRV